MIPPRLISSVLLLIVAVSTMMEGSEAWTPFANYNHQRASQLGSLYSCSKDTSTLSCNAGECPAPVSMNTRRQVFQKFFTTATILATVPASAANARNLPQTTNIDESKTGTIATLVPIVQLQKSLLDLQSELKQSKTATPTLPNISMAPRDETAFKRLLDAYSDPVSYKQKFVDQNAFLVYYSKGFDGPGRATIESDLPVKQTLQYGARNDAWVAWDEVLVEYEFLSDESSSLEDLQKALEKAVKALEAYLSLAPPEDLKQANSMVVGGK